MKPKTGNVTTMETIKLVGSGKSYRQIGATSTTSSSTRRLVNMTAGNTGTVTTGATQIVGGTTTTTTNTVSSTQNGVTQTNTTTTTTTNQPFGGFRGERISVGTRREISQQEFDKIIATRSPQKSSTEQKTGESELREIPNETIEQGNTEGSN
jgi:hypothetical protein